MINVQVELLSKVICWPCAAANENDEDNHEDEAGDGDSQEPDQLRVLVVLPRPGAAVECVPVVDVHVELVGHQLRDV